LLLDQGAAAYPCKPFGKGTGRRRRRVKAAQAGPVLIAATARPCTRSDAAPTVWRLRVIDASVMPRMVSSNTNAASIMIGERGAALLLEGANPQQP
jgi:GMC oxidoreductase